MTENSKINQRMKHVPNILTVARLFLTAIFLWMILVLEKAANRTMFLDIAFVLFVITGLTDVVDGYIARKYNAVSKFGRVVDPLADKFLICGAFLCFAIVGLPSIFDWSDRTMTIIHWGTVVILIARELSVTLVRQWAEENGIQFPASVYGKLKMFTQSFGVGTVIIKTAHVERAWGDWITALTYGIMLAATLISGLEAIWRFWQAKKTCKTTA